MQGHSLAEVQSWDVITAFVGLHVHSHPHGTIRPPGHSADTGAPDGAP